MPLSGFLVCVLVLSFPANKIPMKFNPAFHSKDGFCKMIEKLNKMHGIVQRLEDLQVNFLCCRICLKSSICPFFSQQITLLLNALLEARPLQGASESSQNTVYPQLICFNKNCSTYVSIIFSVSHSLQVFFFTSWSEIFALCSPMLCFSHWSSGSLRDLSFW